MWKGVYKVFQLCRYVRETPTFIVNLPFCRANTKLGTEIKLQNLNYINNIAIIFML